MREDVFLGTKNLTMESQSQLEKFVADVRSTVLDYPLSAVGYMDETSVSFEKARMIVALSCFADGSKGALYVVLRRPLASSPTAPEGQEYPAGMVVVASTTGWMTKQLMLDWVQKAWSRSVGEAPAVLVLDRLPSHTAQKVRSGTSASTASRTLSCVCACVCVCDAGDGGAKGGGHRP
eukprot:GHVU01064183.1.p1 GENE.GHVU01064183.1~~GHVU01064183.1.p1  ORF type:complete len:178 (-),score=15.45 GHVU01064183.1:2084-2617(-)